MLDFDHMSLDKVKYRARGAMRFFKLGGFLILESSENCYHVVFNRRVSWSENMSIVASVTLRSYNRGLRRWQLMQCRKQSATLRLSPKGVKPPPKIVYCEGRQDGQIQEYLEYRSLIMDIMENLNARKSCTHQENGFNKRREILTCASDV
jgi:hypothetical protein